MTVLSRLSRILRRHPRSSLLSHYLDGELAPRERHVLEAHLLDCDGCRRDLASLSETIEALGALGAARTPQLADSVITALRLDDLERDDAGAQRSNGAGSTTLRLVGEARPSPRQRKNSRVRTPGVLRYCVRRAQLRLTVPVALLAGAAITLINQSSMIFDGEVTVGMCAICALNFLVPFIALNLGLAMAVGLVRRRRL